MSVKYRPISNPTALPRMWARALCRPLLPLHQIEGADHTRWDNAIDAPTEQREQAKSLEHVDPPTPQAPRSGC